MKVKGRALSLSCFLLPNSTFFFFLTWAQWRCLYLREGCGRSEEFSGFSSLDYCAVGGVWCWMDGEPHEFFVDCCQVFTAGSQQVCLFSTLISVFVWKSVNFKIFRTPQWNRHSPWPWDTCSLVREKDICMKRKYTLEKYCLQCTFINHHICFGLHIRCLGNQGK